MATRRYWLVKSEPDVYSIDDLATDERTCWSGVRNFRARNFMRDDMKVGDLVLFYHSNAEPPGVAGLARICREAYPDYTAWDHKSEYFDDKASPDHPIWMMVDLEYVQKFPKFVSLEALKAARSLEGMLVVQRGQRLSVQPVEPEHFRVVCTMGGAKTP
jgi:predicted RNA-binding protein with PUA-like domain